jgi:PAS domain S-box-containing protein
MRAEILERRATVARSIDISRVVAYLLAASLVLVFGFAPSSSVSGDPTPTAPKNVLVLESFSDPHLEDSLGPLKVAVRSLVAEPVDFQVEYMETQRFEDSAYEKSLSESLQHLYHGKKLDVIVASAYPALEFALKHRDEIFPGVPIVFYFVHPGRLRDKSLPPDVTGVTGSVDVRGSVELALRLHPGTQNIAVITGTTEFERYWLGVFHQEFVPFGGKVNLIDLVGLPANQLLRKVSALPAHTVAFFQISPQVSAQPVLGTFDLLAATAQQVPTYCIFSGYCVNHGGIGGSYYDPAEQTTRAAQIVSRVLAGEKPQDIPVVNVVGFRPTLDWRQLRRWNIPDAALPADSLVLFREPTLWERYPRVIGTCIVLLAFQALLILGLMWQRAKKSKVDRFLAERLAFELLTSDLSRTFINLPEEQIGATIQKSLGRIAGLLVLDRITIYELSRENAELLLTFSWSGEGIQPVPVALKVDQFAWWKPLLLRGETVLVSDLQALPEEASAEREYLQDTGAISVATVPLKAGSELFGSISFVSTKRRVLWSDTLANDLKVLAEIFSNALMRRGAQETRSRTASAVESERRRARQVLAESEERFRLVADTAPLLMWMSGTDKLCTFFNQNWLDFTGQPIEHELGDGWASGVHPEDLERCLGVYMGAFDARVGFEMEYRLRRFDGKYRWIVDYGVPRFESDGTFRGYIGSCIDITERRLAAESLDELSGRLINAQEEERTRIARELHDDFSQRLALQGIGLSRLWKKLPESEVEERANVLELLKRTEEISSDLHSLSHQLHSSKLEHVGLAPALMGLCDELSSKYKIQLEFTRPERSVEIPKNVALCLFRIAQEALANVVKHSGATQAQVELSCEKNEIRLRIVDAGTGFDPAIRNRSAGLGLVSMRERLRLLGGRLTVESAPMLGTEILAEIPLPVAVKGTQARGVASGGVQI